jgi:5'-deoxynucleotidase YfbR-like HD superfamily hydrolase
MTPSETAIKTCSGKWLDFADPQPDQICLKDIAWGLSREQRFANQAPNADHYYSVARHSIFVASLVTEQYKRTAMLHEAAEAYMRDLPGPLKRMPELAGYKVIEDRIWRVVADKYDLPVVMPPEVKRADQIMLAVEKKQLHPQPRKQADKEEAVDINLRLMREHAFFEDYLLPNYEQHGDYVEFIGKLRELGVSQ